MVLTPDKKNEKNLRRMSYKDTHVDTGTKTEERRNSVVKTSFKPQVK